MNQNPNRRQFLRTTATGLFGLSIAPLTMPLAGCEDSLVEPIAFGRELPFLTPINEFYVKVGAEVSIANWRQPDISAADWALTIGGDVGQPITVRYADLEAEANAGNAVTILKTMRCVIDSNEIGGLIGTALWTGIPLKIFTDRATPNAGTKRFRVFGADGFNNNFTASRIEAVPPDQLEGPLLVTHMNGALLPQVHGGPVRLLLNESFGYKNIKWIQRIEATSSDAPFGTYQDAGFVDDGVLRIVSRMTDPIANTIVPAGRLRASGFAVSGHGAVDMVEISIDGGQWSPVTAVSFDEIMAEDARIAGAAQVIAGLSYPFRAVWTKWRYDFVIAAGEHQIRVRASDTTGRSQPTDDVTIADSVNAVTEITVRAI